MNARVRAALPEGATAADYTAGINGVEGEGESEGTTEGDSERDNEGVSETGCSAIGAGTSRGERF